MDGGEKLNFTVSKGNGTGKGTSGTMFSDSLSDRIEGLVEDIRTCRDEHEGTGSDPLYPRDDVVEMLTRMIYLRMRGDWDRVRAPPTRAEVMARARREAERLYTRAVTEPRVPSPQVPSAGTPQGSGIPFQVMVRARDEMERRFGICGGFQ